jgi:hypothetical protein
MSAPTKCRVVLTVLAVYALVAPRTLPAQHPTPAPGAAASANVAKIPDTPEGRLLSRYIDALNVATEVALTEFTEKHVAPVADRSTAERVKKQLELHESMGKIAFKNIVEARLGQLKAVLSTERAGEVNIPCVVDRASPDRLAQVQVEIAR